jgi:hypothetical protein
MTRDESSSSSMDGKSGREAGFISWNDPLLRAKDSDLRDLSRSDDLMLMLIGQSALSGDLLLYGIYCLLIHLISVLLATSINPFSSLLSFPSLSASAMYCSTCCLMTSF